VTGTDDIDIGADAPEDYPLKAFAAELGRPIKSLIALSGKHDPYLAAVPYRREPAEWFANLYHELKVKHGAHIRRVLYLLVSQPTPILWPSGEPFENTLECWADLCSASRDARYLGLIPANSIEDRRNPDPIINLSDAEDCPAEITVIDGSIDQSGDVSVFYHGPQFSLPTLNLDRPIVRQRFHLETWCEKSTMNDVTEPLGVEFGINVITGVGEMSATQCEQLVARARERSGGRPVRILYISDFDPAGMSMPVAAARKMEFFARGGDPEAEIDLDFQVIPVVLTHEQCVHYKLPRTPIKKSESRAAKFEERFGAGATELDALEALHPGELRRILVEHIERYYDVDLDDNVDQAASDAEDDLLQVESDVRDRYADQIKDLEEERAAIKADGRAALRAVWLQFVEREKAFEERARPVMEAITEDLKGEAPDVDEFDWPEPAEGEEHEDPLFDSTRSYVDQIARYHQHQDKITETELWNKREIPCTCKVCGISFTSSRSYAEKCSVRCQSRLQRSIQFATELGFLPADIARMWECFRDHSLAKGQKYPVGWDAAWRTWVLNQKEVAVL
jgi:hypothetical protein